MSAYRDLLKSRCQFQKGTIKNKELPVFPKPGIDPKKYLGLDVLRCTHPQRKRDVCNSSCPALLESHAGAVGEARE
jgi:hypothetical protein